MKQRSLSRKDRLRVSRQVRYACGEMPSALAEHAHHANVRVFATSREADRFLSSLSR